MKSLLLVFLLVAAVHADEIVLSNGTSIRWKSLGQAGDQLEIVSVDGQKLKVPKADVIRITVDPPAAPLIGATFTKKPLPAIDLLLRANPKRDARGGEWRFAAGILRAVSSTVATPSVLPLEYGPPEEYDVLVVVERAEGKEPFMIGLWAKDKHFGIGLDWSQGTASGIVCVDSAGPGVNESGRNQKEFLLTQGKARTILCKVRRGGISVAVDGASLFEWSHYGRITVPAGWVPEVKARLFLACGSYSTSFKISRLTVIPYPDDGK